MAKKITKADLIEVVAKHTETKKAATEIVNELVETVTANLKKGNEVEVFGFGKFSVKKRKARTGLNPQTKEKIKIPATKVPSFKAAKALKDAVAKK